jgi:triacylglycerol lipase
MNKRTGAGRNPHPISESTADELDIVSKVDGPLRGLNRLQRSLLLAEISMLSYLPDVEAQPVFRDLGLGEIRYIERDGAQAYELMDEQDVVIVCRGTEPNEWNDIKADANALTDLAETIGRVHRGFKREVDDIWPELEETLREETRNVWFAGHSLGGAMATILAGRCELSDIAAVPVELVTFGSPRVGTKRYVQNAKLTHVRWVNNNDIVTRVPPTWLGYRHTGTRMYLDRHGDIRRFTAQQRAKDRWAGFTDGLRKRRFDHFSDHAIANYVEYLVRANTPA